MRDRATALVRAALGSGRLRFSWAAIGATLLSLDGTGGVVMGGGAGRTAAGVRQLLGQLFWNSESRTASDEALRAMADVVATEARAWRIANPKPVPTAAAPAEGESAFVSEREALPEILVTTEMRPVVASAEDALLQQDAPAVYQRGHVMVVVGRESARVRKGLLRLAGSPVIQHLGAGRLRVLMSSAARWVRPGSGPEGEEVQHVPTLPPDWAVKALRESESYRFPFLAGVVEAPTLRADGSVIDTAGYDEATGLLYLPNAEYPALPASPTKDDARSAMKALAEPFSQFRFRAPCDAAAFIASILSLVGRELVDGPCPCFAVRATAPGSGKTLLVNGAAMIATGRPAAVAAAMRDADELRKELTTWGVEGVPIVLFDNVVGAFGSPVLAGALTAHDWTGRLLGLNKSVTVPLRWVPFVTGNNISFRSDCGRRVVPIDLDTGVENPEDITGFRYDPLLGYLLAHRPELVVAALTILVAFARAGFPVHGGCRVGSFDSWDDRIRSAVIWTGAVDPCGGRDRIREDGDADLERFRPLLHAWRGAFGDGARTVPQAIERASEDEDLRDALTALAPPEKGKGLDAGRVGYEARSLKERVVDGLRLERDKGQSGGRARWKVVAVPPRSTIAGEGGMGGMGGMFPVDPGSAETVGSTSDPRNGTGGMGGMATATHERASGDGVPAPESRGAPTRVPPDPARTGTIPPIPTIPPVPVMAIGVCPSCGAASAWDGCMFRACDACEARYRAERELLGAPS